MVTLTSSTQSEQEMADALESHGQTVTRLTSEPTEPPSELPGEPEGVTEPATEPVQPAPEAGTPQETRAAQPSAAEPPADGKPPRGNFESRKRKLEQQLGRTQDTLAEERASNTKLQQQLEAAQAELNRLKPAEATKDQGPVKPKRPTREQAEFDEAKHESLMEQYDQEMSAYYIEMGKRAATEEVAKENERRAQATAQESQERANREFQSRVEEGAKAFDDYNELVEALGDETVDTPRVLDGAIEVSENPAMLIRHFILDHLDNGGKELDRIKAMNPIQIVREVARLEAKLTAEAQAAKTPPPAAVAPPAPAAAPAPAPAAPRPARPRIQKPAEPIEPVGSRSSAATASLGEAKSPLEYIRLRRQGIAR